MTSSIATTPLRLALTLAALALALAMATLMPARRAQASQSDPACVVVGSSAVAEHLMLVGETFEVQLHAVARCSEAEAPLHAVLVLDTIDERGSWNAMFAQVRHFARSFLEDAEPGTRIGLVAHFESGSLRCEPVDKEYLLTKCVQLFRRHNERTLLAQGILEGRAMLDAARYSRLGSAKPLELLLLLSNGLGDEDPEDAVEAADHAKERGSLLYVLCAGDEQDCASLDGLASSPAQSLEVQQLAGLDERFVEVRASLRSTEILDWELALDLPEGLALVEGSAEPAPTEIDADGRVLWRADVLPARSLSYSFRLKALEAGEHRIARELGAAWRDAYGREAESGIWAAEVRVREPRLQSGAGAGLAP